MKLDELEAFMEVQRRKRMTVVAKYLLVMAAVFAFIVGFIIYMTAHEPPCARREPRTVLVPIMAGKIVILTPTTTMECVEYVDGGK